MPAALPWAEAEAKPFLCPVLRTSTRHLVALFLSEKKKNASKTDSYHCFLKVTAGVPAKMNLTDSKHRCAGSACSRCDAETLTSVPTAPHGCLTGLQDGGASPAGPRGAKGPGGQAVKGLGQGPRQVAWKAPLSAPSPLSGKDT